MLRDLGPVGCVPDVSESLWQERGSAALARGRPNRIIGELSFLPLSTTGAGPLFEVFSQVYERGSILVTTNLSFGEWTQVFGSERLTGTLLDCLAHHVYIIKMNGGSYRLKGSRPSAAPTPLDETADT